MSKENWCGLTDPWRPKGGVGQTQGRSLEEDQVASLRGFLWLWGLEMEWAGDWCIGSAGGQADAGSHARAAF